MITIYGNETCIWCRRAKKLAEDSFLHVDWRNIDEMQFLAEMKTRVPEATTIPQIWWNDTHLGGYESLSAFLKEGKLNE